jgi:hypothetical protein
MPWDVSLSREDLLEARRISSMSTHQATSDSNTPTDGKLREHSEGVSMNLVADDEVDRRLAQIEMAGEEAALDFQPTAMRRLSPDVRYLHVSRTIHDLVSDRNRSVGIFLFVASVLSGASTALLNPHPGVVPIIPLQFIQYWCLPFTFGTLAILGLFMSLILIRSRIGLIYEVTKLNILMGLPTVRVDRVNPLSIFFLMHLLVAMLGAASAGLTAGMLAHGAGWPRGASIALAIGLSLIYLVGLKTTYYLTVLRATSETKLQSVKA